MAQMSGRFHKASRLGMSQGKRSDPPHRRREITRRQVVVRKDCPEADNEERVKRLAAILSDALYRRLARPHRLGPDTSDDPLD